MASDKETIPSDQAGDSYAQARQATLSTFGPRVMKLSGPFAGLFRLDYDEKIFQRNYRNPVLVSASNSAPADRTTLAVQTGRLHDLAVDAAALCMNDVLMIGAESLFLQHHVSGSATPGQRVQILEGLADVCRQAGCALLSRGQIEPEPDGQQGPLNLATFVVGVVDHRRMITGQLIEPGDEVIGVAGTGLHGPAYQIVRDALLTQRNLAPDAGLEGLDTTVAEALLRPATVYAGAVLRILRYYRRKRVIAGIAHIREGRLAEDITQILPEDLRVRIDPKSWPLPPICQLLKEAGMADQSLWPWSGAGIGLVMIVRQAFTQSILKQLHRRRLDSWRVGELVKGLRGVEIL